MCISKYLTFNVVSYRTCFALHPLPSPCFYAEFEGKVRCIKYRNRVDQFLVYRYRIELVSRSISNTDAFTSGYAAELQHRPTNRIVCFCLPLYTFRVLYFSMIIKIDVQAILPGIIDGEKKRSRPKSRVTTSSTPWLPRARPGNWGSGSTSSGPPHQIEVI